MSEDDAFYEVLRAGPDAGRPSNAYVRFDEREDVFASLDLLTLITPLLEECPAYWKWAILSAHSALQGAMVCALADTTGTSILSKESAAEMLDWLQSDHETRGEPPKEWLASFGQLFRMCKKAKILSLTAQQAKDILRLHRYFRNNFAHFTPKGWGIEKAGLPRMIGAALDAVEGLMQQHRVAMHLNEHDQGRLAKTLRTTRASLGIG
jgi:hypothetical protein